jgi:hypothetical protein
MTRTLRLFARPAWLLSACVLPTLACSLLADFDGLKNGGAPAPSSTAIDAALGSDAGSLADAGSFADAPAPDAGAHDGCASLLGAGLFCADFDTPASGLALFDSNEAQSPGTLLVSTTRARSGTFALRATRGRLNAGAGRSDQRAIKWLSSSVSLRVGFDIFIEPTTWSATDINTGIFSAAYYAANDELLVQTALSHGDKYTTLAVDPAGQASADIPGLPTGRWVHLDIVFDPRSARATLTVDKTKEYITTGPAPASRPAKVMVSIGLLGYNSPAPPFDVHYDNVQLTTM